jgi:hypothetical protein
VPSKIVTNAQGTLDFGRWASLNTLINELTNDSPELVSQEKKLSQLEGSALFKEFKEYTQALKEKLIRNEEERALDRESRQLYLMQKLVKLELTREEWEELSQSAERIEHSVKDNEGRSALSAMRYAHFAFYANAELREHAMLRNLEQRATSDEPLILIAGGFHSQGIIEKLKEQGIGYALIQPNMVAQSSKLTTKGDRLKDRNANLTKGDRLKDRNANLSPFVSRYHAHMRGEVSWKAYFRVENGRINLYEAFVRAARDRLLRVDGRRQIRDGSKSDSTLLSSAISDLPSPLKPWRDQIILDLADQNEIEKAGEYTKYLDEVRRAFGSTGSPSRAESREFVVRCSRLRSIASSRASAFW